MDNILTSLFFITLYPFTSGTYFVIIPCIMCSVIAGFGLIRRVLRSDFDGLHN